MPIPARTLLLCLLSLAPAIGGCEAIASIRGLLAVSGEIQEHLESDLKTELTEQKIDKVLEVTPELQRFSESAKVKWKPDPKGGDVSQLANALGGLADYMAFFESQDTRITEYYVDVVKIYDARTLGLLRRTEAEARAKLEAEKQQLEAKKSAGAEDTKQLETDIERATIALQKLEEGTKAREEARNKNPQYRLSDAEVARVEARIEEIDRVFKAAGYADKNDETASEAAPKSE
jgi:hypothetical protein